MPSRKGKGRQSLGFGTKSQRAQFHHEWNARLQEDYYQKRRKQQRQQQKANAAAQHKIRISQQPPKVGNSLRRLIAERQHWDRIEDRSWLYGQSQQQKRLAEADPSNGQSPSFHDTSPPGWLLYHQGSSGNSSTEDCCFAEEYRTTTTTKTPGNTKLLLFPTLQSLALHALAKALPQYLDELGVEQLHDYLSLLPGLALSTLSVLTSKSGNMTNHLCRALGNHSQVTRFSLVACAKCEETDPNWKDLQPNKALRETFLCTTTSNHHDNNNNMQQPLWVSNHAVPDSWEELVDDDEDDNNNSLEPLPYCSPQYTTPTYSYPRYCRLERLELGNLPLLQVEVVKELLLASGSTLTHLGLSGSLQYYDCGPDVLWQLSQWVPHLRVLDVSGNTGWVTEPVLRSVYDSYRASWESKSSRSKRIPTCREEAEADTATTTAPQSQPPHLIIKATGCLTRSSQILMEMEFGTLF